MADTRRPDRETLMKAFRRAQSRRLSAGTVYARVRIVHRWWDHVGDPFDERLDYVDVEAYLDELDYETASSVASEVSHLAQFYKWARRARHTTVDPTELVERPRLTPRLPRPITDVDLAGALAVADADMRTALLFASLAGMRCVEIARARWDDINIDEIVVHGKGGRDRLVPTHPELLAALDRLDRGAHGGFVLPDRWRSTVRYAEGMNASKRVAEYFDSLGVRFRAHSLRHWFASTMLSNGVDLRTLQDLMGHASLATTAIYTRIDTRLSRRAVATLEVPSLAS